VQALLWPCYSKQPQRKHAVHEPCSAAVHPPVDISRKRCWAAGLARSSTQAAFERALQVRQSAGLLLKNNLKSGPLASTAEHASHIKVGCVGCQECMSSN
jgi:hypothetical protein